MAKITLTMMQRLNLEGLLAQQDATGMGWPERLVLDDIRRLVKVERAVRKDLVKEVPGQVVILDEVAIEAAEGLEIDLEKAEVRALRKALQEFRGPMGSLEWIRPIVEQLGG